MENKSPEIQIKVDEASFKGTYSNAAMVSHSQYEFLMDFITVFQGKGMLTSRVIVSPNQAKHFLRALNDNIAAYEMNFGPIKEAQNSDVNIESH